MKVFMYILVGIALWFGFLTFVCIIGTGWNVTMVVFQAVDVEFFQGLMLEWEPLLFGGSLSLLLLILTVNLVDEDYL